MRQEEVDALRREVTDLTRNLERSVELQATQARHIASLTLRVQQLETRANMERDARLKAERAAQSAADRSPPADIDHHPV